MPQTDVFPRLVTERLELRPVQPADATFILEGLSDERVTRYYAVHHDSPEAVQEQMQFYEDLLATGTGIWWAFTLKGEDRLIGACGFSALEAEHRKAEIGFWLLPDYWGKGYIPEAARAVISYGFEQLGLNRIEALVEGGNAASEKVLQKLGFTCEGCLREREVKQGHYIDLIYYSMLKREFTATRA
ncbi:ribosomal-protein-alanine N-acetyltransferase [Pontibacter ummariensis]|uniref:Ribosomal-protein-alanine N-acetyltransferase n=1 Tax=Pontibacter ummariensis TaxID=1610492 RepID=A0A239GZS8_9BACT|nr:GNAT family protein [Pontibacter ummariensis]PRY10990.1 ribosomal-protein-alanine N-acetyltransferase [Pontibacter ummariensis]SNS73524.1 ribosomal-protein-alanine N-acetyltransferase [Pontibacter ummariensis]